MRILTVWICYFITISHLLSQKPIHPVLGSARQITIPFDYQQGFMILDLVFGKILPLKFILDTGAENTILLKKPLGDLIHLPYHKRISILGSDLNETVSAFISNNVSLHVANCLPINSNIIVLESDDLFIEQYIGKQVDGILGADFLKGLVLRINYSRNELTLINPFYKYEKFTKNHEAFDLNIIDNKPYIDVNVEVIESKKTKLRMLVDTGAGLTFMLHNNTDSLLTLPQRFISGSLGRGLGGNIIGYAGRTHLLQFGSFVFQNSLCNFQDIVIDSTRRSLIRRNGIIGNFLLDRFDVVIDFSATKLYLKAKKKYNKDFDYDKSGLSVFAFGQKLDQYFIKDILVGSPAEVAGLKKGDIILKIGCVSTKWLTLEQINDKFTGKSGKTMNMKVKRGDEKMVKKITLRSLF